jgi:hypothetical protein
MRAGGAWRIFELTTDDRTPAGLNLALGSVALVAAAGLAAMLPAHPPAWHFGVVAIAVGGFAALTQDQLALGGVVPLGWLVTNGFLEDHEGELSWHGSTDIWLLMILVIAAALGLVAGQGYRQVRDLRARWRAGAELSQAGDFEEWEDRRDG